MTRIDQACRLLGISRVAVRPAAKRVDGKIAERFTHDQEYWFGPRGEPIGIYTPAEGLAALQRCVTAIEAGL